MDPDARNGAVNLAAQAMQSSRDHAGGRAEEAGYFAGRVIRRNCAGAPLARVEVRVLLERFLAHTSDIDLSQQQHGPQRNRKLDFEPSFTIRGLSALLLVSKPN
jgi:hypothetical protein